MGFAVTSKFDVARVSPQRALILVVLGWIIFQLVLFFRQKFIWRVSRVVIVFGHQTALIY